MHKITGHILISCLLFMTFSACTDAQTPKRYTYKVDKVLPHDVLSYTQGLFFYNGELYESAGQYGESSFRKVDLNSGMVLKRENFASKYFIEGSCALDGRLYILTWKENTCFVCDINTFKQLGILRYQGEGWGLTTDGKSLIMSDGSSKLYFRKPDNFQLIREIDVTVGNSPVRYLNELEYIKGEIWANVYGSDTIVRIDPATGKVKSMIDCSNLLPGYLIKRDTDVLNGIAYDAKNDHIYLTGKYWPKMYRISLVEK